MPESRGALYGIAYHRDAVKALQKIEPRKTRQQIKKRVDALLSNPYPAGSEVVKGETFEGQPVLRIRSGDYRTLYSVRENQRTVVVLDIGHRREVYRGL